MSQPVISRQERERKETDGCANADPNNPLRCTKRLHANFSENNAFRDEKACQECSKSLLAEEAPDEVFDCHIKGRQQVFIGIAYPHRYPKAGKLKRRNRCRDGILSVFSCP